VQQRATISATAELLFRNVTASVFLTHDVSADYSNVYVYAVASIQYCLLQMLLLPLLLLLQMMIMMMTRRPAAFSIYYDVR